MVDDGDGEVAVDSDSVVVSEAAVDASEEFLVKRGKSSSLVRFGAGSEIGYGACS